MDNHYWVLPKQCLLVVTKRVGSCLAKQQICDLYGFLVVCRGSLMRSNRLTDRLSSRKWNCHTTFVVLKWCCVLESETYIYSGNAES